GGAGLSLRAKPRPAAVAVSSGQPRAGRWRQSAVSRVFRSRSCNGLPAERVSHSRERPALRPADWFLQAVWFGAHRGALRKRASPSGIRADVCIAGHGARRTVRILITGATGFTGGHLARGLLARGQTVRVLVRDRDRARDLEASGLDLAIGDHRDQAALDSALKDVDVVYHIAAIYRQAGVTAATYRAVNAIAVGEIIDAAARAGAKRVVHCSTVGVHGDIRHPPANEDAPLSPGDIYQHTKLEGEQIARESGKRNGIEVTIVRPSGIYGPGDRRLIKLFGGVARRRFPMLGSGEIYYHLTYIDDLVEGFRLCGELPAAANRTYILAGGEVTTLNELVRLTAEVAGVDPPRVHFPVWPAWTAAALCEAVCVPLGIEPPLYRRRVDFYTKSRAFDISRARQELGYAPQVGLRDGIARTLAWGREHGWI